MNLSRSHIALHMLASDSSEVSLEIACAFVLLKLCHLKWKLYLDFNTSFCHLHSSPEVQILSCFKLISLV